MPVKPIVIALILSLGLSQPASTLAESSAFNNIAPMANTFLDIMDAMADAYSQHRRTTGEGYRWQEEPPSNPWGSNPPPAGIMQPSLPAVFPELPAPSPEGLPPSILEGWWLGESGEVLAFKRDRFRIYLGPHEYQEGRFRILDWNLSMENPTNGRVRNYEYALQEKYLALRDDAGSIFYYIQVTP